MAFKRATQQPSKAPSDTIAPVLEAGGYPARLVQIVDLGLHPGSAQYPEPQFKIAFVFECLDEFLQDKEGKVLEDQPRTFSYEMSYNPDGYMSERSNIHKVMTALDGFNKDLIDLLGTPCNISLVVQPGKKDPTKKYNKVTGIQAMRARDAEKAASLIGEPLFFSLDSDATKEDFEKTSTRGGDYSHQSMIKRAMNLHEDAPQLAAALGIEKPETTDHGNAKAEEKAVNAEVDATEAAMANLGGSVPADDQDEDPFK